MVHERWYSTQEEVAKGLAAHRDQSLSNIPIPAGDTDRLDIMQVHSECTNPELSPNEHGGNYQSFDSL